MIGVYRVYNWETGIDCGEEGLRKCRTKSGILTESGAPPNG